MEKFHDLCAVRIHQSVPLFVVSRLVSGVIGNVLYLLKKQSSFHSTIREGGKR